MFERHRNFQVKLCCSQAAALCFQNAFAAAVSAFTKFYVDH